MKSLVKQLHSALFDLASFMNQPQRDAALIRQAGIELDRALFPLLVAVDRKGPIGVVDLAGIVGRDHTTVSRQVAVMEKRKLLFRTPSATDGRLRLAMLTEKGSKMIRALDTARQRLAVDVLAGWSEHDVKDLARLMRRFADDLVRVSDASLER